MKNSSQQIKKFVSLLQTFADRIWYPPLIGLLAALDNFLIVIPTDALLISSSMLTPKRWVALALCVSIGSTLGATALAAFVEFQGLPWMLELFPGSNQTETWKLTEQFFQKYGLIVVFVVASTPLMQQPAAILAGLAGTPLLILFSVILSGRLIKSLIMAYVATHAPRLINKMWGVQGELQDAGINIDDR